MARRPSRGRTLRDLRAEVEAAEARAREAAPRTTATPVTPRPQEPARRKPVSQPRMRVVWAVCDVGGRPVATFPYRDKAAAEAHAAALQARGKGDFFIRSVKEPMEPTE